MTKFYVDYNKSASASIINWDSDINIDVCEPFIDFIRCDDGEDFQFLNSIDNDFKTIIISHFEAVKTDEEGKFFLCYTADLDIDLNKFSKFKKALKKSDGLVEVVMGFRYNGKVLDCFEEWENRQTFLKKFD
jgi:hypothetical protein|tara:strand:- start:906 stop:1301 length:396 start_codon:yes stop_codon:yes gene_type:complete